MTSSRAAILAQPHRANPVNPATANCLLWASPDKLDAAHARHLAAGRKLVGETPCACGNHTCRMYA